MIKNFMPEWSKFIISTFKDKKFHKISESLDFFIASILQNNPNADIITVQKFVSILSTEYFFKLWKKDEFDKFMVQVFNEIYEKINPLKNNWPVLKEKYEDLTSNISQTLSTSGDEEECKPLPELTEISVKKYIVAILNQNSNYSENSAKVETMNRSLIDDFTKILNQPTELGILRKAVLSLQPYVYNEEKDCDNCGYCGQCIPQKFNTNSPYYITLMKKLTELCEQMAHYEFKKRGQKGDTGAKGDKGDKGNTGAKGEKGDKGEGIDDLATINNQELDKGGNIQLPTFQDLSRIYDNLERYQKKLKLIPNKASKVTNANLDVNGDLRIWDPQFGGSKLVKDFDIIDSTVVGIESTDDTLPTTKYIDKFYVTKNDLLSSPAPKWTSVGSVIENLLVYTLKMGRVYRLCYTVESQKNNMHYGYVINYIFFEVQKNKNFIDELLYYLGEDITTRIPLIYVQNTNPIFRSIVSFNKEIVKLVKGVILKIIRLDEWI